MHFAALLAAVLLAAAGAEDPSLDVARSLATQAQSEYDLGHFAAALKSYEQLYQLKPVTSVLFNVAQCHRKLGQLKEAADLYRSFLIHADPESREAAKAQELLGQVEDALRQQEAVARAAPQGTAPLATAAARPAPEWQWPRQQQEKPPPPPPPPSHKAAYVLGGVAVAALGAGAMLGLQSKSAASQLASPHPQDQAQTLLDDHKSKAKVADLLFALSGALLLGAVIAW